MVDTSVNRNRDLRTEIRNAAILEWCLELPSDHTIILDKDRGTSKVEY